MTVAVAKSIFTLAAVAWFGIRYPHQRGSRATPVRLSLRDLRETGLLVIAATGLSIIPLVCRAYMARTARIVPGIL